MPTWHGQQPGTAEPELAHESAALPDYPTPVVYGGAQPGHTPELPVKAIAMLPHQKTAAGPA